MTRPSSILETDRQWHIVERWQEYAGESRAVLLRIVAIGVLYALQLVHYYFYSQQTASELHFHREATWIVAAWMLAASSSLFCLRSQYFPPWLKFLSTTVDLLMVTLLASRGGGPVSPIVLAYFAVIALAGLRFSLSLIWFATLGAMCGYMSLVGLRDSVWFDGTHVVRPIDQLSMLAAMVFVGVVIGQIVRRVKALAVDYARRLQGDQIP